jgi:hypothetical protein
MNIEERTEKVSARGYGVNFMSNERLKGKVF